MNRERLLELALETLEKQRAEVETAIAELRVGIRRGLVRKPAVASLAVVKRGPAAAAVRPARSLRIKKRIPEVKKAAHAARNEKRAPLKRQAKTAAQKEALSTKMKELWAKRKAEIARVESEASAAPKDAQSQ